MIKNSKIMTLDSEDRWFEKGDIVVEKDKIIAIGNNLSPKTFEVEKVFSAEDKLVIPGLVNAHLHSHDRFDKGRFDNLPLEPWMALYNPPLGRREWTPRECYLRTALNGIEMLKTGTTTVIDDVHHGLPFSEENFEAVYQAYKDIGMRALVSICYSDSPYYKTIPFLGELLPARLKAELEVPGGFADQVFKLWQKYGERWRGNVQFILSASAPQRCTESFLKRTWELARSLELPVIIHVLETKVQAVTGELFYGKSMVEYMHSLGILTPETTLVHCVWLTDRDISLIGEAGACVVHNPMSNLKLGSGIAPIRKMLDAGIRVGLGTDNNNANDTVNLFETIRLAALLHKVSSFDYDRWVGAREVIRMATQGGARCAKLDRQLGSLSVGMKADMVLLDLKKLPFIPRNNLLYQLVFCENGHSVDTVVIDGKMVVEGGKVTTANEEKLVGEIMERVDEIQEKIRRASLRGVELEPYVRQAYQKCVAWDVGFNPSSRS
jgi:guanine deaminase